MKATQPCPSNRATRNCKKFFF